MGLFDRLFGTSPTGIEKYLEDLYYEMNGGLTTRDDIRKAIETCKIQSKKIGTASLPEKFGDLIINEAHSGIERGIVQKAKSGGASEDDIRAWWNLHDLERRMMKWEDDTSRLAALITFVENQGLSNDEAVAKVRKTFPIFGDPTDETHTKGADRPLPEELHLVINEFTLELGSPLIKGEVEQFSSMNAFLRHFLKR